jgi:hypothetical protein
MRGVIELSLDDLRAIDQKLRDARQAYKAASQPNGPGGFWEWMQSQPNGTALRVHLKQDRDPRQVQAPRRATKGI